MAIVMTIDKNTFVEMFSDYDRGNNFSREARGALFDYYDELDSFEMDVVGICCDWSEEHYTDIADNYRIDLSHCEGEDEKIETVREYLEKYTYSIELDDGETFVYQSF